MILSFFTPVSWPDFSIALYGRLFFIVHRRFLWFYLFGGKLLKDVAGFNPVFFSDHFYCYLC